MNQLMTILIASWLSGLAAFVGGIIATIDGPPRTVAQREFHHGVIAFGGGILVAAVAFALAPVSIAVLSPLSLIVVFCFCLQSALPCSQNLAHQLFGHRVVSAFGGNGHTRPRLFLWPSYG